MHEESTNCRICHQDYVVDHHYDAYRDAPYHYDRDGSGYCLACFLGVGPTDLDEK